MKFAQSSFVYFNYPLQEAIKRLHKAGYQGIEIWGGRPHYFRRDLDGEMKDILNLLDKFEMTIPNFIPAQFRYPTILCSLNENIRKESVAYIKDTIDTALQMKAQSISLCPGMTLYGETLEKGWTQLKQSILELLDYTDKTDLKLLIEPAHAAETSLILTIADGHRMLKEFKSDRLGLLLDTGHIHVNGENTKEAVLSLKNVPFHIHIDDNNGDSDAHMVPGDGNFNFGVFKDALKELNYDGFVSAELGFQYTTNPDPAVEKTAHYLKKLFNA